MLDIKRAVRFRFVGDDLFAFLLLIFCPLDFFRSLKKILVLLNDPW